MSLYGWVVHIIEIDTSTATDNKSTMAKFKNLSTGWIVVRKIHQIVVVPVVDYVVLICLSARVLTLDFVKTIVRSQHL